MKHLPKIDPEIAQLIKSEEKRQESTLMMIPSENVASYAVEEAVGSAFGNKYSEGYPNRRYYQGQEFADKLESLVIERAKKLFKVAHVNVQALSGSPANFAVYTALLKPGATIMGLSLSSEATSLMELDLTQAVFTSTQLITMFDQMVTSTTRL